MVDIPTIDLALTGANIMKLRKAAGLSVRSPIIVWLQFPAGNLQMAKRYCTPHGRQSCRTGCIARCAY